MNQYRFKTNINCQGCLAKITPFLNDAKEIERWSVDTADPAKLLTVETKKLSADEVRQIVGKAGFNAEFRTN
jgi:copper chaperone